LAAAARRAARALISIALFDAAVAAARARGASRAKKKAPTSGAQVKEETPMIRRDQRYLICARCQWENSVATLHLQRV
jgi:hypothetical protein